jgi:hypothetical protein
MYFCVLVASPSIPKSHPWHVCILAGPQLPFHWCDRRFNFHYFNFRPSMPPLLWITPKTRGLKTELSIALLQRLQSSITLHPHLHLPSAMRSMFETRDRLGAFAWMNPKLMSRPLRTSRLCLCLPPSMSQKIKPPPRRPRCPTIGILKFFLHDVHVLVHFRFLGFSDLHP